MSNKGTVATREKRNLKA